jgi:hypothetical protein
MSLARMSAPLPSCRSYTVCHAACAAAHACTDMPPVLQYSHYPHLHAALAARHLLCLLLIEPVEQASFN